MPDWMLSVRQAHGSLVTGGMFAERDLLHFAVRKGQRERGLLVNRRRNRANVGIVAEDADKVCLFVFAHVAVNA
jgi:hypothetical protein